MVVRGCGRLWAAHASFGLCFSIIDLDGILRLFAQNMTRFGAEPVLGELGALFASRASSTMFAAGAVPTEVPGKPQTTVLRRPKEVIFHYCRAILKL